MQLEQALVALGTDDGSVVDLVAWDEQAAQKTGQKKARSLKQA